MSNVPNLPNQLTEIPDSAWFYAAYSGKDYKVRGDVLKQIVANGIQNLTYALKSGKHLYNKSINVDYAASITLNAEDGALFNIAQLTGNIINLDVSNVKAGMSFIIRILQGTSAYTCAFSNKFVNNFGEFAIGTTPSKFTQIACCCYVNDVIDYTISYQN